MWQKIAWTRLCLNPGYKHVYKFFSLYKTYTFNAVCFPPIPIIPFYQLLLKSRSAKIYTFLPHIGTQPLALKGFNGRYVFFTTWNHKLSKKSQNFNLRRYFKTLCNKIYVLFLDHLVFLLQTRSLSTSRDAKSTRP